MVRWLSVSLVVFACGGREVSKVKYTHSTCEGAGCRIAPTENAAQFAPPDEERGLLVAASSATAPEPTCALVGETLASLELGNYADAEARAPKVDAAMRRCSAMKLSRDDRQCLVDADDRASVAYCVPALDPDEPQAPALSGSACDAVARQMMTQLEAHLRAAPQPDQRVWERQLLSAIDACRADRWHAQMGQCAASYVPVYPQNCAHIQPHAMWKRLDARLAQARAPAK